MYSTRNFIRDPMMLAVLLALIPATCSGEDSLELPMSLAASTPYNSLEESDVAQSGHHIIWGRPNTKDAYFDDMTPTNVTAVVGQTARLPCRVINLGQKDVTWIRKRDIHILTLGVSTYTSDARFTVVRNRKTKEWILQISPVAFRDAGVYECQVSTSPKISLPVTLNVEVQQARIQGPSEVYIQNGSTISLTCVVNTHSENVGAVSWFRNANSLDYDSPRGGVSLEIEKTPIRTTSKLFITRAIRADSGNYTCAPEFADAAFVIVHVVNGEESAAVQTGEGVALVPRLQCAVVGLALLLAAAR
ncbi:muscle, skeletal receptor tyrosine protein kinase isoform X2 [Hyalella azteca]|uniref:Muscle, skeletal receptor tyrosine protein kinase isoform X2 n=1 Tax=Hyalella azteca TaxID=294128 RepID=A0A8B7NWQ7_HYAAZ|nr:muscle, skeletal receptor tyrosine protein kinase isoform X2 [Hyalella azteca]